MGNEKLKKHDQFDFSTHRQEKKNLFVRYLKNKLIEQIHQARGIRIKALLSQEKENTYHLKTNQCEHMLNLHKDQRHLLI